MNLFREIVSSGIQSGEKTPKEWFKRYIKNGTGLKMPDFKDKILRTNLAEIASEFYSWEMDGTRPKSPRELEDWLE